MATTTKPRSRTNGQTPLGSAEERIVTARKIVSSTKRNATRILADEHTNHSTNIYRSLRIKADAFDEIALVLAGKDIA